jgi:Tfp pilus assembly protein PilF
VNAYRRAIALDPRDGWSLNNLGLLLLEQGRTDEALPLLAKAVLLRKDVPEFHNNLGMGARAHRTHSARQPPHTATHWTADPGLQQGPPEPGARRGGQSERRGTA